MIIFGQRDPKWGSQELGTGNGILISVYGCALTAVSSLLVNCFNKQTDPSQLNQALINVNGYASNGQGVYDLIEWGAINKIYPDVILAFNDAYYNPPTGSGLPADMVKIDKQLNKGISVIAGVSFDHVVNQSTPNHYVEIYKKNNDGTYQCRDPWFADDVNFNNRYAVNGMTVPQCILQAISYNGTVAVDPLAECLRQHAILVDSANLKDAEITRLKTLTENLTQQISDRNNDITKFQADVSTLESQVMAQQQNINMLTPLAKQVPVLTKNLDQAESDIKGYKKDIETLTRSNSQLKNLSYANATVSGLLNEIIKRIFHIQN